MLWLLSALRFNILYEQLFPTQVEVVPLLLIEMFAIPRQHTHTFQMFLVKLRGTFEALRFRLLVRHVHLYFSVHEWIKLHQSKKCSATSRYAR